MNFKYLCWDAEQDSIDKLMNEQQKFISAHSEDLESKTKTFSDEIFDSKRMALGCSLPAKQKGGLKVLCKEISNPSQEDSCKGHNHLQWTPPDTSL